MSGFIINFPLFCIILSLLCAVLSLLLNRNGARLLTLCMLGVVTALSAAVLARGILTGISVTYVMGHFPAPWGNEIRFGILEPLMATALCGVTFLSILGGDKSLRERSERQKHHYYYAMVDLVCSSVLVLCYTNDLFTGYVFIELCTLASCGVLAIRGTGQTLVAAMRYMVFNLLGSALVLLGIILLYGITGHLLMPQLKLGVAAVWASESYGNSLTVVITLVVAGLAIKSGLFPFHIWVADAHTRTVSGSSGILSGVVFKGYIVILIKLIFSVFGPEVFYACGATNVIFIYGIAGMLFGSLSAMRERHFKRMVAYSSVAQIGYIFMGIGISPVMGVSAACFHILTHACAKPALFLSCVRLADVSGGMKLDDIRGAGRLHPVAGVCFTLGAMSLVGIPGFMGFISKLLLAAAGAEMGWKMLPTLLALAVSAVLNAVYLMRTVVNMFSPTPAEREAPPKRFRDEPAFGIAAVVFSAVSLIFGFFSQPLIDVIEAGLSML